MLVGISKIVYYKSTTNQCIKTYWYHLFLYTIISTTDVTEPYYFYVCLSIVGSKSTKPK